MPPHEHYNVIHSEAWLNAIDIFLKCFGFGLSTRPNNVGSANQSQTSGSNIVSAFALLSS